MNFVERKSLHQNGTREPKDLSTDRRRGFYWNWSSQEYLQRKCDISQETMAQPGHSFDCSDADDNADNYDNNDGLS